MNEEEAVLEARARCPDLITSDVQLSVGCGNSNAVQRICGEKPIPVVYITGSAMIVQERCPRAIVIQKPFGGGRPARWVAQGPQGGLTMFETMRRTALLRGLLVVATTFFISPAAAQNRLVEPIAFPLRSSRAWTWSTSIREIAGNIRWRNTKLDDVTFARYAGAPLDLLQAINPLYTELRRGLLGYQKQWSSLPQFRIAAGPELMLGARVSG